MIWLWKWWGSVGIYGVYEESEDGLVSRFSKKVQRLLEDQNNNIGINQDRL